MEVPAVTSEHLAHEIQLFLPACFGDLGRAALGDLLQEPQSVVPDPVAFRVLYQERKNEFKVGLQQLLAFL